MDTSAEAAPGPAPRRRKHWPLFLSALAGVFILIVSVAVTAPWILSNSALRAEIAAQIRHLSGLNALSLGRAVLVVLPRPHISVDEVILADEHALRLEARYLKAYFRLTSLAFGKIEISSTTLGQPVVDLDLDGSPLPLSSDVSRTAASPQVPSEPASRDTAALGVVTIVDGTAKLKTKQLPAGITISGMNLTLDWSKPNAAAITTGQARIGGETATLTAWVATPDRLMRGQQSRVSVDVKAPSLSFSADGNFVTVPKWQYGGRLRAAAPSLRVILEDAGYAVPLPGPLNGFGAICDASIDSTSAVFSGLRMQFDGNEVEGILAFQASGKVPILSGTLASPQLSFRNSPWSLPNMDGRDGQWNQEPFDLRRFGDADFDLRISAGRIFFSRFEIEDSAFALVRNSDHVEVTLASTKAYRGTAKGRAIVDLRDNRLGVEASGVISGADLAALSFDVFGWPEFYGSLTGTADLHSSGSSLGELLRNLSGSAHADVAKGQLARIDLESAVRRIDKSPLAFLTRIRQGRTAFDRADFGLRFDKGIASIEEGKLEGSGLTLAFGGTIDFAERGMDLHAVATSSSPGNSPDPHQPDFRFDVGGSWDDLVFSPDVGDLIRRSGAAAPLFPQQPVKARPPVSEGASAQ